MQYFNRKIERRSHERDSVVGPDGFNRRQCLYIFSCGYCADSPQQRIAVTTEMALLKAGNML